MATSIKSGRGPVGTTVARLRILDSLLCGGEYRTSGQLHTIVARRLADIDAAQVVTLRQIQYDLNTLEELWLDLHPDEDGAYEFCGGKPRLGRRYRHGQGVFVRPLSRDEAVMLGALLPVVGPLAGRGTLRRIEALRSEAATAPSDALDIGIRAPRGDAFASLFTAITDRLFVRLSYHTFARPDSRSIDVFPRLLRQFNGRWFLLGNVASDGFAVTLRLDQIDAATVLPDPDQRRLREVYPACEVPLDRSFFRYAVGVTLPSGAAPLDAVERIVLWISDRDYPYFATKPPVDDGLWDEVADDTDLRAIRPDLVGGRFLTMDCYVNHEMKQLLMSYMDGLAVIEPAWLAAEMRERVARMDANYNLP